MSTPIQAAYCGSPCTTNVDHPLPMTGFDAGFMGIAGIAIIAVGAAVRRLTR